MSYRTSTETPRDFILTGYNDPRHPQYCPIEGNVFSFEYVKSDPRSTEAVIASVLFKVSSFPASAGCISGYAQKPESRALQQVTSRYRTGVVQQGAMRHWWWSLRETLSKTPHSDKSAPPKELLTLERELSQLQSETRSLEQYVHQSLQLTASAYQMLAQKIKKLSERLELTVVEDGVLSPEDMALGKALIRKLAQYQTRLLFASSDCRLNFLQHRTEYVPHGSTNQGIGESNPNIPRWRNYFKHTWRQCVQKVEQAEEGMKKHQGINRREDWTHFLNRVEATRTLSEEATRRGASKTGGTPDGDTYNWFSPTPSK
ncbi:hypothetical protein DB88DRAFT_473528 [Papiliotrema laurentii]|uniref:Uncharacterized protein n=1 Tax=Papiliotrema laurentii TaxID=5418 RepID=A0AAD9D153_PAPLA|nr:hypothetical protein DB88DRAFT_473528 [Papiliotrema laurentii]